MEIIDDFLDQEKFDELQSIMMGGDRKGKPHLPWFYSPCIDSYDELDDENIDKFQFTHMFYCDFHPQSPFYENVWPVIAALDSITIWRVKANLLTRTPNIVKNSFHVDMIDVSNEKLKQYTTAIFYINTNNGYTKFEDGTKVESVANRMITFPANLKHTGTSCTDEKIRIVINFNYFKRI